MLLNQGVNDCSLSCREAKLFSLHIYVRRCCCLKLQTRPCDLKDCTPFYEKYFVSVKVWLYLDLRLFIFRRVRYYYIPTHCINRLFTLHVSRRSSFSPPLNHFNWSVWCHQRPRSRDDCIFRIVLNSSHAGMRDRTQETKTNILN